MEQLINVLPRSLTPVIPHLLMNGTGIITMQVPPPLELWIIVQPHVRQHVH